MLGSLVVSFKELILLNWKVSEMEFISKREKKISSSYSFILLFKFVSEMGIQFLDQLKSPLRLTHEFQLLSTSEKLSFYFSLLLSQDKLIGLYGNIKCNMTSEVFFKFIVLCDLKLESSRWTLWVVFKFHFEICQMIHAFEWRV